MAQGSPEKSSSSSSEEREQLHDEKCLSDELNPAPHSSPRECPVERDLSTGITKPSEVQPSNLQFLTALQSNQAQQAGTSISRTPITGEFLAQLHGKIGGISAAYLHGNSHSREQHLPQRTQLSNNRVPLIPIGQTKLGGWYGEPINKFNPLLSNLPTEYRMSTPTPSRFQQHIGLPQAFAPFGNAMLDVNAHQMCFTPQAQRNAVRLQTPVPIRAMRIHNIPNPMNASSGYNLAGGRPSYAKAPPSISGLKRKMAWEDNNSPRYQKSNSSARGCQRYASVNFERYSLYDKRYEALGLPIDPHLRIFNAMNENVSGDDDDDESSKKSN